MGKKQVKRKKENTGSSAENEVRKSGTAQ